MSPFEAAVAAARRRIDGGLLCRRIGVACDEDDTEPSTVVEVIVALPVVLVREDTLAAVISGGWLPGVRERERGVLTQDERGDLVVEADNGRWIYTPRGRDPVTGLLIYAWPD